MTISASLIFGPIPTGGRHGTRSGAPCSKPSVVTYSAVAMMPRAASTTFRSDVALATPILGTLSLQPGSRTRSLVETQRSAKPRSARPSRRRPPLNESRTGCHPDGIPSRRVRVPARRPRDHLPRDVDQFAGEKPDQSCRSPALRSLQPDALSDFSVDIRMLISMPARWRPKLAVRHWRTTTDLLSELAGPVPATRSPAQSRRSQRSLLEVAIVHPDDGSPERTCERTPWAWSAPMQGLTGTRSRPASGAQRRSKTAWLTSAAHSGPRLRRSAALAPSAFPRGSLSVQRHSGLASDCGMAETRRLSYLAVA